MLKEFDQDTIAAISTPLGYGGIGVIRLSGPNAIFIADQVFQASSGKLVKEQASFSAQHGYVVKNRSNNAEKVDEVIVLLMRAPKSYTCEDVVEISAHGGSAVLKAILDLLIEHGARLAAKGEFTKRAFLNGRIDLLQAEAVLDLVKADTELGRKWATSQLGGFLSREMKTVKDKLVNILSYLEALIDFPEDHIEEKPFAQVMEQFNETEKKLLDLLSTASTGFRVKQGFKIVIAGRPNVGKSSLMNRLVKDNRVIVTPFAGTTRDAVEEQIQIQGFPVRIVDTAGIQETAHPIEKEGIERSKAAVLSSDAVLYVVDSSQTENNEDEELFKDLADKRRILILNKSDLSQKLSPERVLRWALNTRIIKTSCLNDQGIRELENEIVSLVTGDSPGVSESSVITSVRQKDLLDKSLQCVKASKAAFLSQLSPELVAVEVRSALDHLGMLVGEVVTDDVLDVLFNQFCIGK